MSQTKRKTQNAKRKTEDAIRKTQEVSRITFCVSRIAGFTLIEIIIAVSIIMVVAVISSSFLLSSLGGTSKAEITKEVRQNGDYAISVMQGLILSSKTVSCTDVNGIPSNKEIRVTDLKLSLSRLYCDDVTGLKISSNSSDLTAGNVAVSGCNFVCTVMPGKPSRVAIDFTVSQKGSSGRPNEKSSMRFQTEVITKNY